MTDPLQLEENDVKSATLEYRAVFADPIFEAWGRRTELLASIFRSLKPWIALPDIATFDEGSGNARLEFKIPSQRLTITVSLGYLGAVVTLPDWSQLESLLDIARKTSEGLVSVLGADVRLQHQTLALSMHVLPRGQDLKTAFSRLANPSFAGALAEEAVAWGFAVYGPSGYRVIDISRVVPGAIYVGLHRVFGASDSPQSAVAWLRQEEDQVLGILGIRV